MAYLVGGIRFSDLRARRSSGGAKRPLMGSFRGDRERPELAALRPSRSTEFDALLPVAR